MKPPPFMLGLGLLFWGWQTGLTWFGIAAAVLIETPRFLSARWQFSQADLDRVWNVCVALFLGGTIYAFFSSENLTTVSELVRENSPSSRLATLNQSKRSLFQLLEWLPLMFLPMALAQAFAEESHLDLSTFSWWLRRRRADPLIRARYLAGKVDVGYGFFACCLFSASTSNQRTLWFSLGLVGLTAWALWVHRPRSFGAGAWTASLLLAVALGGATQVGMLELQKLIQRLDEALLARWGGARNFDTKENQTRIGAIGRMKLSGRIVLRVASGDQAPPPLLREASYNAFRAPAWLSSRHEFEPVTAESNQSTWVLQSVEGASHQARISGYLRAGQGLLAVPLGLARLDNLPVLTLKTNRFGAVRVEDAPGFVEFDLGYSSGHSVDSIPTDDDRDVPPPERAAVAGIASQLRLTNQAPRQALQTVERFFAEHFTYSLWHGDQYRATSNRTALARFLLENRSGHCEYFATATVLLLRAAGIPARYAAGYAVQEKKGPYYLVRERHAHAWCLAWIDHAWRDVDTTPANWAAAEANQASIWEPVGDFLSRLWFEFSRWRWGHSDWKRYLLWLIVPVLSLLVGRLVWERQWSRAKGKADRADAGRTWPGLDSEFYAVEKRLAEAGLGRLPTETGTAWLERVSRTGWKGAGRLLELLPVHYRMRFDPHGLATGERAAFRQRVAALLEQTKS